MGARRMVLGVVIAASACALVAACESSSGGGDCFPPEHGPNGPSCAGFDLGLTCPVGLTAWMTCVCVSSAGTSQTWACAPAGSTLPGGGGSGGSGGGSGGGGSGGTDGGDAG